MRGKLITLEGINGMGKTFFINKLKEKYKDNPNIVFNDEITDGNHEGISNIIFDILFSTKSRFFDIGNPKAETLLMAAKQSLDENNYIEPLLKEGKIVISDRGYDSVCILEGIMLSKKFPRSAKYYSNMLYDYLKFFNIIPNRTILLDGDVEKSICRAEKRDRKNSYSEYTEEEKSILNECFKLYKEYSHIYKERFITINRDEKSAFKKIVDVIEEEIRKEG